MKIFNGKKESLKLLNKLKAQINASTSSTHTKLKPHLAVFLIGEDKASKIYVNLKKQAAENIGVKFSLYKYKKDANEADIIKKIKELNKDKEVSGIIVQLPLPEAFSAEKIISGIDPKKDADGFHKKNLKALKAGESVLMSPVLPGVILHTLRLAQKKGLEKKKIKALVNSKLFGDVLRSFFLINGLELEFFVAKNSSLEEVEKFIENADVLISVVGKKEFIKGKMLKDGVILIDSGITKKGKKVYGDFEFESCLKKAKFLTPVPGGVGPMTVALLLRNVVFQAFKIET